MKTNHDGTITLNAGETYSYIACSNCGKQVYADSIHTCSPQIKELSDEEILEVWRENERVYPMDRSRLLDRTRACIKKASEK